MNRFYDETFTALLGSRALSSSVEVQCSAIEAGFDLVQQEMDVFASVTIITGLQGFPASFAGNGLKYLRVNAAESSVEFVAQGGLSVKSVGGTSYTLLAADAGSLIIFTSASPVTVTVNSGVLSQGAAVCMRQGAAGQVTVAAGVGVTIQSSDSLMSTRKQGAQIALIADNGSTQYGLTGERNAPTVGAAFLNAVNVFTAGNSVTPVALTAGASLATNAALGNVYTVTLNANSTLANPTNLQDGQVINWYVRQASSGGPYTLAFGSNFAWPAGTVPTQSTGASAIDMYVGQYVAAFGKVFAVQQKAFA